MKRLTFILLLCTSFAAFAQNNKNAAYFPPAKNWQHQAPAQMGLNADAIQAVITFAQEHETKTSRNGEEAQRQSFGREPYSNIIGPVQDREGPAGLIIYKGYIIAEWGDPARVDMTHSVTKSFLSAVVGLAVDKKLIHSTLDTVNNYLTPIDNVIKDGAVRQSLVISPFATTHNKKLTWEVMLRQTSDWEGTLWGKPDWADRPEKDIEQYKQRQRNEPGAVWKYNDVRVNALALATLKVWGQPLPKVLKKYIMDPIGASNTWHWYGYDNSWVVINGEVIQSVSGGGHWGGGMFINAYDMGRFGLLTLHHGNWNGKQLISEQWVKQALTPTTANTGYGYMNWFLNTDRKLLPSAPEDDWVHIGNGTNMIWCDPGHDLVVVARWIDSRAMDGLAKSVLAAFPDKQ